MFRKPLREFTIHLLAAIMIAARLATWAVVEKAWTWPNAIVGGVLLTCGLVHLMDRLGIGPSTRTQIRNWLDDSGFGVQTVQDEKEFHFILIENVGLKTDIFQTRDGQPINIVMGQLVAMPAQLTLFNGFDQAKKDDFWKRIRLELIRFRIQYTDLKLDGEGIGWTATSGAVEGRTRFVVDPAKPQPR